MRHAKEIQEELNNVVATLEVEARYMRERNERLESENEYLKKQVDVLLKIVGGMRDGS
jgi:FtsZ-binding cell division protein ZapB